MLVPCLCLLLAIILLSFLGQRDMKVCSIVIVSLSIQLSRYVPTTMMPNPLFQYCSRQIYTTVRPHPSKELDSCVVDKAEAEQKRHRKHRKCEGAISLQALNNMIAERWRKAPSEVKEYCEEMAEIGKVELEVVGKDTAKRRKKKKKIIKQATAKERVDQPQARAQIPMTVPAAPEDKDTVMLCGVITDPTSKDVASSAVTSWTSAASTLHFSFCQVIAPSPEATASRCTASSISDIAERESLPSVETCLKRIQRQVMHDQSMCESYNHCDGGGGMLPGRRVSAPSSYSFAGDTYHAGRVTLSSMLPLQSSIIPHSSAFRQYRRASMTHVPTCNQNDPMALLDALQNEVFTPVPQDVSSPDETASEEVHSVRGYEW
jgi:hypothetical protein